MSKITRKSIALIAVLVFAVGIVSRTAPKGEMNCYNLNLHGWQLYNETATANGTECAYARSGIFPAVATTNPPCHAVNLAGEVLSSYRYGKANRAVLCVYLHPDLTM